MKDTVQSLDYGARWLRDGLHEAARAGTFEVIEVDVSEAARILERLKSVDRRVTWTHIFIRTIALTLARNPDLHQVVAGNRKMQPTSIDICLSVASEASVTAVLVIEDAANKDIFAIAAEVISRSPQVVREYQQLLGLMRRWGWIVPLSVLRRNLFRFLFRRIWYRRKINGTFQISCLPQVDIFAPLLFNTTAVLGVGGVRDRVIAENGVAVVRPVVSLTCCLDHSVWNGMAGARFLTDLRNILQSGEFAKGELPPASAPVAVRMTGK